MRPIGSYFGWTRGSDSRNSTPTDTPSRRVSQQLLWDATSTDERLSPFRGLDGMQECFWIEDNLRHTGRKLDTCSERLNRMSDSAIHIRKELEDLQNILASMRTRGGGARRDSRETGPKDLDGKSPQSSPLPSPEKIESPSAQSIEFQDISPESASYTTASVQTIDEREMIPDEKVSVPHQHAPEYLNVFPEILDSIEEECLPQNDTGEEEEEDLTVSSLSVEEAGSKEDKQEEESQQTPRSVESSALQEDEKALQDVAEANLEKVEEQPQTPRPMQLSPPEQNHTSQTAVESTIDDEEHQRTPRSLRPNPVQKRFPFAAAGHSAAGGSRATRTMLSNRASLKPVIGQKKVSQMTQFWSQKMGTTLDG